MLAHRRLFTPESAAGTRSIRAVEGARPEGETFMATKTIDVTLAAIRNAGTENVSPKGAIQARIVRAVDDEQIFQSELLYFAQAGQPIHPSGATHIPPGQSLTYNVIKR